MTGDPRRWASDNGSAGTVHFFGPFLYRSPFHATTEAEECERALAHLEQVVALEGPGTIAAIVLESVPGTAGIMLPPPGYLAGVRDLCDRHGIVLIADEVMTGFGRTGRWFGVEHFGVVPDLITFAKGVNSGYVPLGGVIINEPIAATFDHRAYPGGLTYSGHPLACAAAVATIETMRDERDRRERRPARRRRSSVPAWPSSPTRTRRSARSAGIGAFWALELVSDPASPRAAGAVRRVTSAAMNATVAACKAEGLLPFVNYNRIHVVPPLNISDDDARRGLAILDRALASPTTPSAPEGPAGVRTRGAPRGGDGRRRPEERHEQPVLAAAAAPGGLPGAQEGVALLRRREPRLDRPRLLRLRVAPRDRTPSAWSSTPRRATSSGHARCSGSATTTRPSAWWRASATPSSGRSRSG